MADPTMQDPTAQDDGSTDSGSGSYVIEITVTSDGKISVGVESADEENAEESGQGGESSGDEASEGAEAQPVPDFASAMKLAKEIYANNGQMSGDGGAADAQSGFNSVFSNGQQGGGANG